MYNILMNNPEGLKTQEWLNDDKERSRRLGQLGLSGNEDYSGLSKEEKQFLNMDWQSRKFIEKSFSSFNMNRIRAGNEKIPSSHQRKYIDNFVKTYNYLSDSFISPDEKESGQLALALTDSLFSLGAPIEKLTKIKLLMEEPDTPNFAKQMATFRILYPDIKSAFSRWERGYKETAYSGGADYVASPVLQNIEQFNGVKDENGRVYKAEEIIYTDILKCAFGSGGKNIERFLDKLSGGECMMRAIMCWPDSADPIGRYYSKGDLDDFQSLIRQMHSMHYQTRAGEKEEYDYSLHNKYRDYGEKSITEVKSEIQRIYDEYKPTKKYSLADRVVRSFCSQIGIKNLSEAYDRLSMNRAYSYSRHKNLILRNEVGKIRNGDFVKSIGKSDYLPYLLESGVLANEYLGIGAQSDCTPLDTDVAMITDDTNGLRYAIRHSCAAAFSGMGNADGSQRNNWVGIENVFLVFRNDYRFSVDDSEYNWGDVGDRERDSDYYYDDDYDPWMAEYEGDGGIYYDEDVLEKHKRQHRYYGEKIYNKNKYEVFPPLEHFVVKHMDTSGDDSKSEMYEDDYGIRTGIPSSEIDYIATDGKSAEKVVEAVKKSNLYIPVTDLDGNLIYNPCKVR